METSSTLALIGNHIKESVATNAAENFFQNSFPKIISWLDSSVQWTWQYSSHNEDNKVFSPKVMIDWKTKMKLAP